MNKSRIKSFLIILTLLVSQVIFSVTVKQDGTGDFTTIQAAVEAVEQFGDITVYPGIYVENIVITDIEYELILRSIYANNPADSIIRQTVIDGNQSGSCIRVENSQNVEIQGFTLTNGSGSYHWGSNSGGGIQVLDSDAYIRNCHIEYNLALKGGGIELYDSLVGLSGNTIRHNNAESVGGGIYLWGDDSNVIFDPNDRNSVYLNYSSSGADIFGQFSYSSVQEIYIDTFTVAVPDYFFYTPTSSIDMHINEGKITQIESDVYVATNGDDANNGLSWDSSFQTIAHAQQYIKSDSLNQFKINLAPGIYTEAENQQFYPLAVKDYVALQGSGRTETILDFNYDASALFAQIEPRMHWKISDLTLHKAYSNTSTGFAFVLGGNIDIELTNVTFSSFHSPHGVYNGQNGKHKFTNVVFENNNGGRVLNIFGSMYPEYTGFDIDLINTSFINNNPFPNNDYGGTGGAALFQLYGPYENSLDIVNCEFSENRNNHYNSSLELGGTSGIIVKGDMVGNIVNSNFGNNILDYESGGVMYVKDAELNIYNSILYGNNGQNFLIFDNAEINVYNSLIQGGDSLVTYLGDGSVNWYGENMDFDPLWQIEATENPYAFQSASPCIDAGTMNLPDETLLPELDLAGNPRIFGNSIDLGCYEWNGTEADEETMEPIPGMISNYPNPFNPQTTINYTLPESDEVKIQIYNLKGQLVKILVDGNKPAGLHSVLWNAKGQASGIYFYKIITDSESKTGKCLLLK